MKKFSPFIRKLFIIFHTLQNSCLILISYSRTNFWTVFVTERGGGEEVALTVNAPSLKFPKMTFFDDSPTTLKYYTKLHQSQDWVVGKRKIAS